MKYLSIPIFCLLVACGTHADYESWVRTWVGKPLTALEADWGQPQMAFDRPQGGRVYRYDSNRVPGGHVMNSVLNFQTGRPCTTVFYADAKGLIEDVTAQGAGCTQTP